MTRHRATARHLRRLIEHLERERHEILTNTHGTDEWRIGFCDGLEAAQRLIRKGA
ncbi:hypothetical protein [Amycolatopsis pithecellobii]|uniref:Uncharacterized protein n=1 Tax=Amycolatopsis pithecellobii TaxID=664692 RepID=A0A6N7YLS2_9PSEU|nr:hypothetical protein [Amycolatopsis pithecellobii]MTD53877.1 hypothetical protein [Amycolatopsis pithecellobii]